jgi:ankyrin repeat protein
MDPAAEQAMLKAGRRGDMQEARRLVQQDRRLLEAGSVVSVLGEAARGGHLGMVRYLLDEGAQVNRPGLKFPPLFMVCFCEGEFVEVVALLLKRGADPWLTNPSGCTPLMAASLHGHARVVRTLLAHGYDDIDDNGYMNCSALYNACKYGRVGAARVLLEAGADPTIANQRRARTALDIATQKGKAECVALLQVGWSALALLHAELR